MDFFKQVVAKPDASRVIAQFDFGGMKNGSAWLVRCTI